MLRFPRPTPVLEEDVACACGELPQTVEHVLLHCPDYTASRRKYFGPFPPRTLQEIFNPERFDLALGLLKFLEETRACVKPRRAREPG